MTFPNTENTKSIEKIYKMYVIYNLKLDMLDKEKS